MIGGEREREKDEYSSLVGERERKKRGEWFLSCGVELGWEIDCVEQAEWNGQ